MDQKLFDEMWARAPRHVHKVIKDFAKYPTERNSCYVTGYLAALDAVGAIDSECYLYLLSLAGQYGESEQVRTALIDAFK